MFERCKTSLVVKSWWKKKQRQGNEVIEEAEDKSGRIRVKIRGAFYY